jgi:hypothetical protein
MRSSYQSCETPPAPSPGEASIPQRIRLLRSSPRRSCNLAVVCLVGLCGLALLGEIIPTANEMMVAKHYDLPMPHHTRKIRHAQSLADTSRLSLLSPDWKKMVKKLDSKKGKKGVKEYGLEPPEGCEATVIIVRHCEKTNIREHCSYAGYERSVYLASIFGDEEEAKWPLPSYIFAESPGHRHNPRKMNFREVETVGPLAEKAHLDVDDTYSTKTKSKLVREILTFLQTGQMCGKVTVIAWKHSDIAHIAHHLGCGPMEGCPVDYRGKNFDEVWQIKFVYDKFQHSHHRNLDLPKHAQWRVFGAAVGEGFDPLTFSKKSGDYPPGGTDSGGRWGKDVEEVPERKSVHDRSWKETRVGFS